MANELAQNQNNSAPEVIDDEEAEGRNDAVAVPVAVTDTDATADTDAAAAPLQQDKSIPELIEDGRWDIVTEYFRAHPEEIRDRIDPSNGATILHAVCAIASAPTELVELVADAWRDALTVRERRYGLTPLHTLCWTSGVVQRGSQKVEALLERYPKPSDLLIRNSVLGSTVLHSACGSHADLSVLEAIVRKHPPVLLAKTFDQKTAFQALWQCHLQSIPVHMQIARILNSDRSKSGVPPEITEKLFERTLKKMNFLAIECFKLSPLCPDRDLSGEGASTAEADEEYWSRYTLHGMLEMKAPLQAILVALKLRPELASTPDRDGNYPLHHALARRPFRVKYTTLLRELVSAHPGAACARNSHGLAPIHIALRERVAWEDGLGDLLGTAGNCDQQLQLRDPTTGLYPCLLGASLGGTVAVNTVYNLLVAKPDLVRTGTPPPASVVLAGEAESDG